MTTVEHVEPTRVPDGQTLVEVAQLRGDAG